LQIPWISFSLVLHYIRGSMITRWAQAGAFYEMFDYFPYQRSSVCVHSACQFRLDIIGSLDIRGYLWCVSLFASSNYLFLEPLTVRDRLSIFPSIFDTCSCLTSSCRQVISGDASRSRSRGSALCRRGLPSQARVDPPS